MITIDQRLTCGYYVVETVAESSSVVWQTLIRIYMSLITNATKQPLISLQQTSNALFVNNLSLMLTEVVTLTDALTRDKGNR